ncbi:hypothetical protein CTM53_10425 [Prevotella intermedia]|uniref:Uncharacterized protein n=1 Tax=Prevotella intermedia TaxID=28131 RepID=A0AAJ3RR30_PREIN|nr:hypothetical protein CTM53_10425 [Prevotella intermedia]
MRLGNVGARFTTFLTPKIPPFSMAIGLPHLPLGTWGITLLLSPTIQIKQKNIIKCLIIQNKTTTFAAVRNINYQYKSIDSLTYQTPAPPIRRCSRKEFQQGDTIDNGDKTT